MKFTVSYDAYLPNAIDRGTAFQSSENQTATVCLLEGFIFNVSQRRKEALKECSCL